MPDCRDGTSYSEEEYDSEEFDTFGPLPPLQQPYRPPTADASSHTVFVLDMSGSMRIQDVVRGNLLISRADAVFDCCAEYVTDQIENGAKPLNTCSIITFNDTTTRWTGYPNPPSMRPAFVNKIRSIKADCIPEFGTKYLAGLRAALYMCNHMRRRASVQSVIFLSDGKPGDLNLGSRNEGNLPQLMEELKLAVLPGRLQFHAIGVGSDNFVWLQKMAACVEGGKFHNQRTGAKGLDFKKMSSAFRAISSELTSMRSSSVAGGAATSSGNFGASVSYSASGALMQPRVFDMLEFEEDHSRFWSAAEDVHTHMSTAPFGVGASRNAFRLSIDPDDQPLECDVEALELCLCRMQASGTLKPGAQQLVAKQSRVPMSKAQSFTLQEATFRSWQTAERCLAAFKEAVCRVRGLHAAYSCMQGRTPPAFLKCCLMCSGSGSSGRYLAVEQYLEGTYTKFNGNNGHVHAKYKAGELKGTAGEAVHDIAHAFSHFSWVHSNGLELVCDIQGVGLLWTDPQVNSSRREYGAYDMGEEGIVSFFATHTCNGLCRALRISSKWPQ